MDSFTRMHGLGNRFVVFRGPKTLTSKDIIRFCKQYDKDGADGLLVIEPVNNKSVKMKYWNADGSLAEMCGNGLRCATRYAVDNNFVRPGNFAVITDAGPLKVKWDGKDSREIEVQVGKVVLGKNPITLNGVVLYIANVGNPHAITFVEDLESAPVEQLGPKIETNIKFPNKTNVEFVKIQGKNNIKLRTWERGVGETKACGTGIVAAVNTAVSRKDVEFPVQVEVLGGATKVWLDEYGFTRMLGPAVVEPDPST